jgi:hypothetical protein
MFHPLFSSVARVYLRLDVYDLLAIVITAIPADTMGHFQLAALRTGGKGGRVQFPNVGTPLVFPRL